MATKHIYLVMDAGSPVAAFTVKRKLDTFRNPLVYTFGDHQGPSIMTMSRALAE